MKHQMQLLFLIPSQTGFEFQTLRKRFPYDPPLLSLWLDLNFSIYLTQHIREGFPLSTKPVVLPFLSCSHSAWGKKTLVQTAWLSKARMASLVGGSPSPRAMCQHPSEPAFTEGLINAASEPKPDFWGLAMQRKHMCTRGSHRKCLCGQPARSL